MSDLFALLFNRLRHGEQPHPPPPPAAPLPPPPAEVPLNKMDVKDIAGFHPVDESESKIYMDAAPEYSEGKKHITTVKADELTAILQTLEHFTIRKNVPKILQLRYEINPGATSKKEGDEDGKHNMKDLMYKTDFLLQDNVRHVFKPPIFTPEARYALSKLVHRMDSDTSSNKEMQSFNSQREDKKLLAPKEQEALNTLYPHLLNLLKVLMVYDNNYVNYQLSGTEMPEPVVYKMWQGVQFKVRQIWNIICDATEQGLLTLEYPLCDLNHLAIKTAGHRLYLQKQLADSEKALAELNAQKQKYDAQIREIQVQNIGLEEKIRIATGTLQLNAIKLHEHRDERRRALNNLKLIAYKTNSTECLERWCSKEDCNRIMEDMRSTRRVQEDQKKEAAAKARRFEDED